jgi:hypothetical protein
LTVVKVQQVEKSPKYVESSDVCFSLSMISIPYVFLAVFCNVWLQFVLPFITKSSPCWCFIHIVEHIGLLSPPPPPPPPHTHTTAFKTPWSLLVCCPFQFQFICMEVRGHFLFPGATVPRRFIFLFSRSS